MQPYTTERRLKSESGVQTTILDDEIKRVFKRIPIKRQLVMTDAFESIVKFDKQGNPIFEETAQVRGTLKIPKDGNIPQFGEKITTKDGVERYVGDELPKQGDTRIFRVYEKVPPETAELRWNNLTEKERDVLRLYRAETEQPITTSISGLTNLPSVQFSSSVNKLKFGIAQTSPFTTPYVPSFTKQPSFMGSMISRPLRKYTAKVRKTKRGLEELVMTDEGYTIQPSEGKLLPLREQIRKSSSEISKEQLQERLVAELLPMVAKPYNGNPTTLEKGYVPFSTGQQSAIDLAESIYRRKDFWEAQGYDVNDIIPMLEQVGGKQMQIPGDMAYIYNEITKSPQFTGTFAKAVEATRPYLDTSIGLLLSTGSFFNRNFGSQQIVYNTMAFRDAIDGMVKSVIKKDPHEMDKFINDISAPFLQWSKFSRQVLPQELVHGAGASALSSEVLSGDIPNILKLPRRFGNYLETVGFGKRTVGLANIRTDAQKYARMMIESGKAPKSEYNNLVKEAMSNLTDASELNMYNEIATWNFDYADKPLVFEKLQKSPGGTGRLLAMFPNWIYNLYRLEAKLINPANIVKMLNKKNPLEERTKAFANLVTGAVGIWGLWQIMDDEWLKKFVGKIKDVRPTENISGRMRVGSSEDNEWWARIIDMPFIREVGFLKAVSKGYMKSSDIPQFFKENISMSPHLGLVLTLIGFTDQYNKWDSYGVRVGEDVSQTLPGFPQMKFMRDLEKPYRGETGGADDEAFMANFGRGFAENLPGLTELVDVPKLNSQTGDVVEVSKADALMRFFVWNVKKVNKEALADVYDPETIKMQEEYEKLKKQFKQEDLDMQRDEYRKGRLQKQ